MISQIAVEYANKWNCKYICHGATGKGNDQIRFDNYITTLNPKLKILAPVREWAMGREEEIAYAKEHNIPVTASLEKIYSYDENLWGCSAEGGEIEDFKKIPPLDRILKFTELPEDNTPDFRLQRSEYIGGQTMDVNVNPIAQTSQSGDLSDPDATPQGEYRDWFRCSSWSFFCCLFLSKIGRAHV